MQCQICENEIKAEVTAAIETIEGKEVVCLFITCEHCFEEYYGTVITSIFETI